MLVEENPWNALEVPTFLVTNVAENKPTSRSCLQQITGETLQRLEPPVSRAPC